MLLYKLNNLERDSFQPHFTSPHTSCTHLLPGIHSLRLLSHAHNASHQLYHKGGKRLKIIKSIIFSEKKSNSTRKRALSFHRRAVIHFHIRSGLDITAACGDMTALDVGSRLLGGPGRFVSLLFNNSRHCIFYELALCTLNR